MTEEKRETKQVIVMRTKYPDGKGGVTGVRKGKLCAQAAHASMAVFFERALAYTEHADPDPDVVTGLTLQIGVDKPMLLWAVGTFAKVVVYVDTEEELLAVYESAQEKGLPCSLIEDSGRTEFNGVTTPTAVAVGPSYVDLVDEVTGHLPLL